MTLHCIEAMSENLKTTEIDAEQILVVDTNMTVGDQIQELQNRLQNVTNLLHQQVAEKHDHLLQQASQAGRFENALEMLSNEVELIRHTAKQTREQVETQYNLIENQTKVQSRMNELSHLLRSAGTLLTLTAKLKGTKDLLKQAELHYELGQLLNEDLTGIEFIQKERAFVLQARQKLKNLTQMQLVTGLQERNEAQVKYALKIISNLNSLEKSLENLITTIIANLEQSLRESFSGTDISVINKADVAKSNTGNIQSNIKSGANAGRGPGKAPQLTTTQNFRAKFWKSLHWLIYDELFECCEQVRLLKHALEQVNYTRCVEDSSTSLQRQYWKRVQDLFRKSFAECPAHVTQTLQEGLSKLLSSARGLEKRLNNEFLFENDIFEALENGYVSKSAANMKMCLAGVDLPNNEAVDNFIHIAATELSAALIDGRLTKSIAAVFMSCSKELCTKLEAQIKLGADTKQVVDMPNIQQMQNVVIANILFYYKDSVRRMLQDLGDHLATSQTQSVRDDILKSLGHANLLISTILQQIMDSILATINIIMLSMHREPDKTLPATGISFYMKELQEFIERSWSQHVAPFEDKELTANCGNELGKKICILFVHNLCIVRPLSQTGRMRLKNDCGYLEQALKPMCPSLSELGKPARLVRAISFLIIQETKELMQQSAGGDSLVPSYLVLFLLFAHAGSDLQSPHTTVNWSNERLIEWLDGHTSEREKLELISGALQRYRDSIRRKNSQKYDNVYPLMVEFFEKAIKATTIN